MQGHTCYRATQWAHKTKHRPGKGGGWHKAFVGVPHQLQHLKGTPASAHGQAVGFLLPRVLTESGIHVQQNLSYEAFRDNKLASQQLESLFIEDRQTLEQWMTWKREALELKARAVIAATLTPAWRRLVGPASQLLETLMLERVTAELETGQATTGHIFATQDALAAQIGVTARTLRNWLSPEYAGHQWLMCWLDRRTWYMTRQDGNRSRGGTIWRVSLEMRGCDDLTRAPKVSYDALRTPWRFAEELPGARSAARGLSELEAVLDYKGSSIASEENVPKKTGMVSIQVEGRHRSLFHAPSSRSDFHTGNHPPTPARAQFAQAWAKAEIVASRLGDGHSKGFWFKQFRALEIAGKGDAAIWAAVGQGLEARAASRIVRGTAAGYAVGVLRRTTA